MAADYPEHDKLQARKDEAETLGELWDWMQEQGIVLAEWGRTEEREIICRSCRGRAAPGGGIYAGLDYARLTDRQRRVLATKLLPSEIAEYRKKLPACPTCGGSCIEHELYTIDDELQPLMLPPQEFIGRFLGIDPSKLSDEKDQMLAEIRDANAKREAA